MTGLNIDGAKCVGCGLCLSACSSGALRLEDGTARADSARCVLCGLCADACPSGAISIEKEKTALDLSRWSGVWVFAQHEGGVLLPVALELLSRGRVLADDLGEPLCAVVSGPDEDICRPLLEQGADRVYFCRTAQTEIREEPFLAALLTQLMETLHPAVVLFGATPLGRSLAPRLAARLGTGLTADCSELSIDPASRCLYQTRPAFGGNLMATIVCAEHRPQMATVRPGVLPITPPAPRPGAQVVEVAPPAMGTPATRTIRAEQAAREAAGLQGADIIVSVGRGIGVQKNIRLAEQLAERLDARLGCSRPLVEAGWLSYDHQIGQTGVSVSPKLLITFGISGAVQHLAGISGAERIIAVNSDPEAPIFSLAHESVVGDCVEILREMLQALEAESAGGKRE